MEEYKPDEYEQGAVDKSKLDTMLTLCKNQGYVPHGCYIMGALIFAEVNRGVDPCAGCNLNRKICHGRPKK